MENEILWKTFLDLIDLIASAESSRSPPYSVVVNAVKEEK